MLKDSIEEMKEELAKLDEVEEEEQEEPAKEEEKPEEKKEEEEEKPEEEKPDNAAMARMRREAAAAKKRADELEVQLAEAKKPKEEVEEAPQVLPELEEIVLSHRQTKAEREFQTLEAQFARDNPEYEAVSTEYTRALMQSIRVQNPRMTPQEISEQTTHILLSKAAKHIRAGYNPIEEMFHEAKELGFTGKSLQKQEEKTEEEEIRPDMKKLAANRKKSTGMGASNGKSEGQVTLQAAADFSPAEWKALPAAEKRRLLYG